jgi:hypothetical protein
MPSSFIHGVLISCLISLNLGAQAQSKPASHVATPGQNRKFSPLTPLQRTSLNILQTAEAEALPPPARAYLLLEISSSYIAINPAKERGLRLQAFQATLAIEDDDATRSSYSGRFFKSCSLTPRLIWEKALPTAMFTCN